MEKKRNWTRAKKQMYEICQHPERNSFLDQYLWALRVTVGIIPNDATDRKAASEILAITERFLEQKDCNTVTPKTVQEEMRKEKKDRFDFTAYTRKKLTGE